MSLIVSNQIEEVISIFKYGKFGNFRENFIFGKSIKRLISNSKNSQLGHDLPISVNNRVILPFYDGFIFTFRENKTIAKNFRIYSK